MDTNFSLIKSKLEKRHSEIKENLVQKHKEAFNWVTNNTAQLAAGAMGSVLLLSTPTAPLLASGNTHTQEEKLLQLPEHMFVIADVKPYLPDTVQVLLPQQEEKIAEILTDYYGFKVTPEIDGKRLLHTYGYIGAEQHLMRYPGDTMDTHFTSENESSKFGPSGMAPGRGAFGYFASSKDEMKQKQIDEEKYYIAVQTFLAKDYGQNPSKYKGFFNYRKMLVVNPNNGKAVVVVIGDSGPAVWTGKQLGGSPEVMKHLERVDGAGKGAVLYFFIDDPNDQIPLGPIEPKGQGIGNSV